MQQNTSNNTSNNAVTPTPGLALALGSGVARGFAHIGVLKVLRHHNIHPSIVTGTSMGALVGGCYLSGKLDALEEWALSLNKSKLFSYLDLRIRRPGLIGGEKLKKLMEGHLGDINIEDLPCPFVAITTDLGTGHEIWLRKGRLSNALVASFSLPGIFPPVNRNGRFLIDGALVNPVPVSTCVALGSRMTLAIDLNTDFIGKAQKKGHSIQTIMGFDVFEDEKNISKKVKKSSNFSLARRMFKRENDKAPSLFGVMVSSLNIIQDRLTRSRLAGDPPDIHLRMPVGHIGMLEFEKAGDLIKIGEDTTEASILEIKAAMQALL